MVGIRIRELRLDQQMTQEGLAKRIGTARTSVTNLEQGNQAVPLHQLFAIAEALDVEVSDILPTRAELKPWEPPTAPYSGQPVPPPQTAHLISTLLAEPEEPNHD